MPAVVFVTAHDEYALRAFEAHAIDYLLKPFSDERFQASLDRAIRLVRAGDAHALMSRMQALLAQRPRPRRRRPRLDKIVVKELAPGAAAAGRANQLDRSRRDVREAAHPRWQRAPAPGAARLARRRRSTAVASSVFTGPPSSISMSCTNFVRMPTGTMSPCCAIRQKSVLDGGFVRGSRRGWGRRCKGRGESAQRARWCSP